MAKRLSPIEKDKIMQRTLNRMKCDQIHRGVLKANSYLSSLDGAFVGDDDLLHVGSTRYKVVAFDGKTATVRLMGNEQNS